MAGETVVVGCKLPNGHLITVGETTVRLNGSSKYLMPVEGRKDVNTEVVHSDGLTLVDKALWDAWYTSHKLFTPVKNGHIYASPNRVEATAKAKDTRENKTGLEPLDVTKIKGLEPADGMKAEFDKVSRNRKD